MSGNKETNVDPFESHYNLAIEAQDGKAAPSTTTDTETGDTESAEQDSNQQANAPEAGDSNTTNDKPQQQAKPEGEKDKGKVGNPGDLTLPTGEVITAGKERRFYEQREVARQQANHFKSELERAQTDLLNTKQQMQTLRDAAQAASGLAPEQTAVAVRMFNDMRNDPVGTLKKLLAEATAAGYKIEGIAAGVDAEAIRRTVENAVQLQTQNAGPTQEDYAREAQQEWANFTRQYPDVIPHEALIAQMLSDNPAVSIQAAYFDLKNAFIERGLDFSKPLSMQQPGVQKQQSNQQQLPQGRVPANGNMQNTDKIDIADNDASFDDIVREMMREAGMNI